MKTIVTIILIVLLSLMLCLTIAGQGMDPGQRAIGNFQRMMAADPNEGLRLWHRFRLDYRMIDSSLHVAEQTDFLLTPALIVQEALDDDVIPTYPEE